MKKDEENLKYDSIMKQFSDICVCYSYSCYKGLVYNISDATMKRLRLSEGLRDIKRLTPTPTKLNIHINKCLQWI